MVKSHLDTPAVIPQSNKPNGPELLRRQKPHPRVLIGNPLTDVGRVSGPTIPDRRKLVGGKIREKLELPAGESLQGSMILKGIKGRIPARGEAEGLGHRGLAIAPHWH